VNAIVYQLVCSIQVVRPKIMFDRCFIVVTIFEHLQAVAATSYCNSFVPSSVTLFLRLTFRLYNDAASAAEAVHLHSSETVASLFYPSRNPARLVVIAPRHAVDTAPLNKVLCEVRDWHAGGLCLQVSYPWWTLRGPCRYRSTSPRSGVTWR
jgi:hypothetical protein